MRDAALKECCHCRFVTSMKVMTHTIIEPSCLSRTLKYTLIPEELHGHPLWYNCFFASSNAHNDQYLSSHALPSQLITPL